MYKRQPKKSPPGANWTKGGGDLFETATCFAPPPPQQLSLLPSARVVPSGSVTPHWPKRRLKTGGAFGIEGPRVEREGAVAAMASPRVSAPRWDSDGVLIGGARWKPVSGVRLQRYGFEFDALVRGEAHERAEKRVSHEDGSGGFELSCTDGKPGKFAANDERAARQGDLLAPARRIVFSGSRARVPSFPRNHPSGSHGGGRDDARVVG